MTDEEKLLRKAESDIESLVDYVIKELKDFSDLYDYEYDWVVERFTSVFHKKRREM